MPLVNRTFDQLIDFTRTSAATFVNSSGNIASTPQSRNLLTFTQEFDNAAWTKTASTVTANSTAAPDGTMTADKAIATAAAGYHVVRATVNPGTAAVNTFSIYAKAAEYTRVHLGNISSTTWGAAFDLSNGTVIATYGSGITPSITSVGNGWYRCSVTFSGVASGWSYGVIGYPAGATLDAAGAQYTGDGVSGIFIWGAQLEFVPDASLTLGSEVVANGDFSGGSTGWAVGTGWAIGSGVATATATNASLISGSAVTAGRTYRVAFDVTSYTAGTLSVRVGTGTAQTTTGAGSKVLYLVASNTAGVEFYGGSITLSIDNVSVREITGTVGYPTDYTRNFGGLFPPRFDYDPVTRAPRGLLIEEQRTNLLTYSEQFDNAAWTKSNATVTADSVTSPDGTADADSLVEDTATAAHSVYRSTGTLTGAYAATCYVKPAGRSWCYMEPLGNAATRTYFNLSGNGSVGTTGSGVTASITAVGNGWYRITTVYTYAAGAAFFTIGAATADATPSYAGNGAVALYLWGAQLEAGAFATSYIPTVASQVTRTADTAAINAPNFASWYNQSSGTFVVEADSFANITAAIVYRAFGASDGTGNNVITGYMYNGAWGDAVVVGGAFQADLSRAGSYTANTPAKFALAYAANDFAVSVSGNTAITDTSGTIPTVDRLGIGALNSINQLNGHIRSLRFYPVRLTNAQLQALTA